MGKAMRARPELAPEVAVALSVSRFWFSVDSSGGQESCWPFLGDCSEGGYGVFVFGGQRRRAHELALTFATGEVRPDGYDTCHSCDNPPCCNPRHLRFGTRQDNVDDMLDRGRGAVGSRNGSAKLTEDQIVVMRTRRAAGAMVNTLAADFGVCPMLVSGICRGLRWRHAGGPIVASAGTGPKKRSA